MRRGVRGGQRTTSGVHLPTHHVTNPPWRARAKRRGPPHRSIPGRANRRGRPPPATPIPCGGYRRTPLNSGVEPNLGLQRPNPTRSGSRAIPELVNAASLVKTAPRAVEPNPKSVHPRPDSVEPTSKRDSTSLRLLSHKWRETLAVKQHTPQHQAEDGLAMFRAWLREEHCPSSCVSATSVSPSSPGSSLYNTWTPTALMPLPDPSRWPQGMVRAPSRPVPSNGSDKSVRAGEHNLDPTRMPARRSGRNM